MKFSNLLVGTTAALVLNMAGGVALSADLTLTNLTFDNSTTVDIQAPGRSEIEVYLGEADFTAKSAGHTITFGAFCVDFYHDITTGPLDLPYDDSRLYTYSDGVFSGTGTTMSTGLADEIGGLVNYGLKSNNPVVQEAVQALIWEDMGATLTHFGNSAVPTEIAALEHLVGAGDISSSSVRPDTIYAANGLTQGFAVGVPEPASWGMMLLGFGMIGGWLRVRRSKDTLALSAA
jgi:PEP-CTERM motif